MSTTLEDRIRAYAATLDAATPRPAGTPARPDPHVIELATSAPVAAPHRDRRLVGVAALVVVALVAGAVAVVALAGGHDGNRVSTVTSVPHPTTTSIAPTTTSAAPTTTVAPTRTTPTEADVLAPFFRQAGQTDRLLKTAAAAVNADLGPTTVTFRPSTMAAVAAANPTPVAASIPAGLPPALLRSMLVVFSELVSRYDSIGSECVIAGSQTRAELAQRDCFVKGAPAAARFPADLAAARTLAATVARVAPAAASSRAAAEVSLQVDVIYENNGGCAATGGFIVSDLAPVIWKASGPPVHSDGTVAGMPFQATYNPSSGWTTRLLVC